MAKTEFEIDNAEFSRLAHNAARKQIYPHVFGCAYEDMEFENMAQWTGTRKSIYDGEMAIDVLVKIKIPDMYGKLTFSVQERFRRPESKYLRNKDVTITEYNHESGKPSELLKILALVMLYGFYDPKENVFPVAMGLSVPELTRRLVTKRLQFKRKTNKKNQSFCTFKYTDLLAAGIPFFYYDRQGQIPSFLLTK